MTMGPPPPPTSSRWVRNVREERRAIRGEIRPSQGNEITDRPVKPSSAGIPLSFPRSDTVVTDRQPISANIYQEEEDRGQEGARKMSSDPSHHNTGNTGKYLRLEPNPWSCAVLTR